jgi:hypothetical protein
MYIVNETFLCTCAKRCYTWLKVGKLCVQILCRLLLFYLQAQTSRASGTKAPGAHFLTTARTYVLLPPAAQRLYFLYIQTPTHSHCVLTAVYNGISGKGGGEHCVGIWPYKVFIHSTVCLTTGPWILPNRVRNIVRASASSFNFQCYVLSLR